MSKQELIFGMMVIAWDGKEKLRTRGVFIKDFERDKGRYLVLCDIGGEMHFDHCIPDPDRTKYATGEEVEFSHKYDFPILHTEASNYGHYDGKYHYDIDGTPWKYCRPIPSKKEKPLNINSVLKWEYTQKITDDKYIELNGKTFKLTEVKE